MHEKRDAVRYRIFRIAVWFAPFFYIIDAAARSWSPSDLQGFLTNLLRPSPAEIAVRLIIIAVWLVFSWLLIYLAGPSPAGAPTAPSRLERRILDANPDPVIIGSASWEIVDCNSAATALYGYDREMFIGKPVWFLRTPSPQAQRREIGTASRFWSRWKAKSASAVRTGRPFWSGEKAFPFALLPAPSRVSSFLTATSLARSKS